MPPEPDYGPPAQPVDPVACPAARLEKFANLVEAPLAITTEPIVDSARIDQVPCKPTESDAQCLARARARPAPASFEVVGVTIGGDGDLSYTYTIDGREVTETAQSLELMVARLKQLQAAGHQIVVLRGGRDADAVSRHAAIAYRAVGGRERRVATLRWHSEDPARTMARAREVADQELVEIRAMEIAGTGELVIIATCGPGGSS